MLNFLSEYPGIIPLQISIEFVVAIIKQIMSGFRFVRITVFQPAENW
ncbi:hypothetical protein TREAZ_1065 [Leadbettera azotonutricia ZAS-9]|uniref:Uncharacterized protein n=1 Tax=Leadbettera azotonutricia (strain ATCC BAA-888 / DSM 13862 / ZAS-9) TaxID=545695 RepID=F5Y7L3_LEAAZ|nr:hypothetical protein TREAZ_1065 [Leadbettera azotonutricia ZAS-9]